MKKTDWDNYYSIPYKTSTYSRKITSNKLIRLLKQYIPESKKILKVAELGGANSCFYEIINKQLCPQKYLIVDNNQPGLDKTLEQLRKSDNISLKYEDVLNSKDDTEKFDIVFSFGLIEHFSPEDTQKCILAHFNYLESNGICIITFPTPTWLYRITRKSAELLGIWIFHDERPLKMNEVINEVKKYGIIKHESITWPIFLTQGVILAIKN
jgi:hypothetical protein